MRIPRVRSLATAVALAILLSRGTVRGETIAVSKTYNNAPFGYTIQQVADRPAFRVYRLTYPSPVVTALPQNNTVPADYYLPKQIQAGLKYPAVICLHILDGNEPLTDLMCSVLAGRGIPSISFKLPYYGDRGTAKGPEAMANDPQLFVGAIAQAGEDLRRTIDVLASRSEINPERIGVTGISLGGIMAAAAAGSEPRLYRAGLILSGGDLLTIIHHARETRNLSDMIQKLTPSQRADVEKKITAADPLTFAPGLRDRAQNGRVLMINASQDEVIPRQCTAKLAEALGIADRVAWLDGLGHYTALAELPRALRMTADFFAKDLPVPPTATNPSNPSKGLGTSVPSRPASASQRLASLLQQLVTMLTVEPAQGRCHVADLELSATTFGRPITGSVRWICGTGGQFSLRCQLPEIGQVWLGQAEFPWMAVGEKTIVAGTKNPLEHRNTLSYVEPRHAMKVRMAAGLAGSLALAPDMLNQWITVEDAKAADGHPAIRITAKDQEKVPGEIQIAFADDGRTPTAVNFNVAGVQGSVRFHEWNTNKLAPVPLDPPFEGRKQVDVEQADLHHMFAAILNFAAERVESGWHWDDEAQGEKLSLVARDPAGHGVLCHSQGRTILMVSGTPQQMGAAHGLLLRDPVRKLCERVVYLMGGGRHDPRWHVVLRSHGRGPAPHVAARPATFLRGMRRPGPGGRRLAARRPLCQPVPRAVPLQRRGRARQSHHGRSRAPCPGARLHVRDRPAGCRRSDGLHARRPQQVDEHGLCRLHRHRDGHERARSGHRRDGRTRRGPMGRHAHEPAAARRHGAAPRPSTKRSKSSRGARERASITMWSATSRAPCEAFGAFPKK